jgi:hypothetical protein
MIEYSSVEAMSPRPCVRASISFVYGPYVIFSVQLITQKVIACLSSRPKFLRNATLAVQQLLMGRLEHRREGSTLTDHHLGSAQITVQDCRDSGSVDAVSRCQLMYLDAFMVQFDEFLTLGRIELMLGLLLTSRRDGLVGWDQPGQVP